MAKKDDNEWVWIVGGVVVLWWLTHEVEEGGKGLLDKLFGWGKPPTRFEPMPDWKQTEYQPTEIEITPKATPARLPKMALAYAKGFRLIFGKTIPRHTLAMLLAQSAVEVGNWKHMWEWNPANITTLKKRGFFMLPDDKALPYEQRHKYAPYPDAQTGAQAHIATLMRVHVPAWELMLSDGSPEDVARALKRTRFYEATDVEAYGAAMRGKYDEILRKLPPEQEPAPPAT